ncbi:MAG: elongation factor P [Erythrobacter sp.]|jgi:hypothetical protein|nr:elongation factor P [Erythrobacter sp.]
MKNTHVLILTLVAAIIAGGAPLIAQEGRPLDTMPHGIYQCALPGDAAGDPFEVIEAEGFRIGHSSTYSDARGSGTYLLRGREFVFTSGPRKGERFERTGDNSLRRMGKDGKPGRLTCKRLGGTG